MQELVLPLAPRSPWVSATHIKATSPRPVRDRRRRRPDHHPRRHQRGVHHRQVHLHRAAGVDGHRAPPTSGSTVGGTVVAVTGTNLLGAARSPSAGPLTVLIAGFTSRCQVRCGVVHPNRGVECGEIQSMYASPASSAADGTPRFAHGRVDGDCGRLCGRTGCTCWERPRAYRRRTGGSFRSLTRLWLSLNWPPPNLSSRRRDSDCFFCGCGCRSPGRGCTRAPRC